MSFGGCQRVTRGKSGKVTVSPLFLGILYYHMQMFIHQKILMNNDGLVRNTFDSMLGQ